MAADLSACDVSGVETNDAIQDDAHRSLPVGQAICLPLRIIAARIV